MKRVLIEHPLLIFQRVGVWERDGPFGYCNFWDGEIVLVYRHASRT